MIFVYHDKYTCVCVCVNKFIFTCFLVRSINARASCLITYVLSWIFWDCSGFIIRYRKRKYWVYPLTSERLNKGKLTLMLEELRCPVVSARASKFAWRANCNSGTFLTKKRIVLGYFFRRVLRNGGVIVATCLDAQWKLNEAATIMSPACARRY